MAFQTPGLCGKQGSIRWVGHAAQWAAAWLHAAGARLAQPRMPCTCTSTKLAGCSRLVAAAVAGYLKVRCLLRCRSKQRSSTELWMPWPSTPRKPEGCSTQRGRGGRSWRQQWPRRRRRQRLPGRRRLGAQLAAALAGRRGQQGDSSGSRGRSCFWQQPAMGRGCRRYGPQPSSSAIAG
jgi:hypothetical protein